MTRSHKIGWLVLVLAVLFMLWRLPRLHGQGFGSFSHDQPYLAADKVSATGRFSFGYSNIYRLWVSEDLSVGKTNQWTDRIVGDVLTEPNGLLTNTADGILLAGGAYLTNAGISFPNNAQSVWLQVIKPTAHGGGVQRDIWVNKTGEAADSYIRSEVDGNFIVFFTGANYARYGVNAFKAGSWTDWMLQSLTSWTNNVLLYDAGASAPYPTKWITFGAWRDGSAPWGGYVRVIALFTNGPSGQSADFTYPLPDGVRSNLHYSITNYYTDITP